jgi:TolB-like protein/Flp pilus assembly protein TadD
MEGESSTEAHTLAGAVFLSYASEDANAAERIASALRSGGIEVWFDKSELRGGDAWDRQIREQIHHCRLFIAVISANSERRDEGYFRREWSLAADRTRDIAHKRAFLVPVVIDGTPERGASVPEKFHELQWTRLPGGETSPDFVARIQKLLVPDAPTRAAAPIQSGSQIAPASKALVRPVWQSKSVLWVGSALLAVGMTYFVADRFWLSKRTASAAAGAAPASATAAEKSIAVLPFVDLSERHDQEYFADGVAEEVLNQLAKIPGLSVIGRTSSFQFKGKAGDLRTIGTTLGAAYVLEGSVRQSGDRVRVTAQLLGTQDGTHRWSDTYDAKLDDVLKVQDDIAASLARALEVAVDAAPKGERGSTNPEAYDLYLRGLHALDMSSKEGCEQAIELFNQALQLEPGSTRTLVQLAWAHDCIGWGGWLIPGAGFVQAREVAIRVVKVDPNSADAHLVLANVDMIHDWDWPAAEHEIQMAFKLAPPNSRALTIAGRLAGAQGHFEQATERLQQALARDPMDPLAYDALASVYLRSGHFGEAEAMNRRSLQIAPHIVTGHYWLAIALLMQGRLQEALVETEREKPADGRDVGGAVILYAMHRLTEADAALTRAIEENQLDWPSGIARTYAFRGDRDQAMTWFERAYQARDADLVYIKGDPLLGGLAADPRYKAFLRKMNLPE